MSAESTTTADPSAAVTRGRVDGPRLARVVSLTDAVVAIAMTLLVLPLVETAGAVNAARPGSLLADHGHLFLSFVISFVVVYVFWAAHGAALRRVEAVPLEPRGLRELNLIWLLVIAFLPFPTAVVGRELTTTSAPVYIGTMLVLSALTSTITTLVDRAAGPTGAARWAWLTTAVFAACTVVSVANADLGVLALLTLAIVRLLEIRTVSIPPRHADRSAPPS